MYIIIIIIFFWSEIILYNLIVNVLMQVDATLAMKLKISKKVRMAFGI